MKLLNFFESKSVLVTRILFAAATLVLAASFEPADAATPAPTLATLLDRAMIENLLADYYSGLGGDSQDFRSYYIEDGILDVNGIVAQGRKQIADLYAKIPESRGTYHMLFANPKIVVNGDSATVDVLWTGMLSENIKVAPHLVEQGHEHDELVKRSGRWYIKHRWITSDGGMPAMYEKTYKKR